MVSSGRICQSPKIQNFLFSRGHYFTLGNADPPPPPPFCSHQIDCEQLNSLVNKHVNTLHFCWWFFVSFSHHGLCLVLTCEGVVKYLHWVTLFHKRVHPDLINPIPVVWALKTNCLTITNRWQAQAFILCPFPVMDSAWCWHVRVLWSTYTG